MKKSILLITVWAMVFSLSAVNLRAQEDGSAAGNGKQQIDSPFLITGKIPHLTKLLIKQWDNPALQLSDTQKSKLLVVRQETIAGVQKLGRQIAPLEKQVAEEIFIGKTPAELASLVQTIAGLKAAATMVHLRCVYDTSAILDQRQLQFLKSD